MRIWLASWSLRVTASWKLRGCPTTMGVGRIFFQGATRGFFLNFSSGGPKVVKFYFSHSKLRKQPFLLKISKSRRGQAPLPPPSDAHTNNPWQVPLWETPFAFLSLQELVRGECTAPVNFNFIRRYLKVQLSCATINYKLQCYNQWEMSELKTIFWSQILKSMIDLVDCFSFKPQLLLSMRSQFFLSKRKICELGFSLGAQNYSLQVKFSPRSHLIQSATLSHSATKTFCQ